MSETDFLKLKKHDNVETNTEKFDIENYLNGNWDKINENAKKVNTDISNINSKNKEQDTNIGQLQENTETSSNKIAELEKELKEAQEDFYQNSIRGQASGEYIHVEDSSNCRARINIGGNHEQETRSGKNYLNTLAKYKAGEKVTVDGITYIFNEDGSITCNGTATADSVLTFSSNLQTINGSGKKIVGMITGTQVPAKLSILAYTSDWSKNTFELLSSVNKNITINMQENIDYTIFRIITYKGTTLNNQTIYYQILDTSVNDLTYEQYGASPSPNYPSEVKCVGSNINIFDKDNPDMFLNGLTPDNSGNIVSTLTDTTKTNYIITIIVPCKGNKQYTISRWLSGKTFIVYESEKNKFNINDKVTLLKRNDNSGIINETIATSANAKYILVKIYSTWVNEENTYNDLISSIKIEKGKVATPHSKFGQGCVKVTKCNNNLFNKNDIVNKAYINSSGEIVSNDGQNYTNYISVVSNAMYTIHAENPLGAATAICFYDTNKKILSGLNYNNVKSMSFKTPSNCDFVRASVSNINLETLQIEEGPATTYEEHEEQSYIIPIQQAFKSIGDIRDTFIKKDDKWYERHNINRRIFDGTTNKFIRTSGTANNLFVTNTFEDGNIIVPLTYGENVQHFNNYFQIKYSSDEMYQNANYVGSAIRPSDDMVMGFGKESEINTVDKANAWLKAKYDAGAPLYVDYLLETPIDIECTEEQNEILDELNNARTYKNVTNITTDSKAILSLDYAKDQETQNQKMQNEIDEIKQLLSTTQTSALLLDNMQNDIESEVE